MFPKIGSRAAKSKANTMRTAVVSFILLIAANAAIAEKINLDNLTAYEKSLFRWAWCREIFSSTVPCEFGCNEIRTIHTISILLYENGRNSEENDPRRIYRLARQDTLAALLTGKIAVNSTILARCERDMLKILAEEYVPNFDYLQQSGQ